MITAADMITAQDTVKRLIRMRSRKTDRQFVGGKMILPCGGERFWTGSGPAWCDPRLVSACLPDRIRDDAEAEG